MLTSERQVRTFTLERFIDLSNIVKTRLSLKCQRPILYIFQYIILDRLVQTRHLEDGDKVIHELP